MFKKLKDKITEEVKQSPLKSVQQLAQAVVSPSSSSVFEPSNSNDKFCIEEGDIEDEAAESSRQSQVKPGEFTSVALRGQTSSPAHVQKYHSHLSSAPIKNDADNLFPTFEPQPTNFHVQSDWESASEVEDRSSQLDHINKESLFDAYRKVYNRYTRIKGKYHELVTHYRQLEREKDKAKSVLTETQDKALLRISELREQCVLEQQAKAHLEEALRNEVEERDHIINTLKTKVHYLKEASDESNTSKSSQNESGNLIDFTENTCVKKDSPSFDKDWFEETLNRFNSLLRDEREKLKTILDKSEDRKENKTQISAEDEEVMLTDQNRKSAQPTEDEFSIQQSLVSMISKIGKEIENLTDFKEHYLQNENNKSENTHLTEIDTEKRISVKENTFVRSKDGVDNTFAPTGENLNLLNEELNKQNLVIKDLQSQNDSLSAQLKDGLGHIEELNTELNYSKSILAAIETQLKTTNENIQNLTFNVEIPILNQNIDHDIFKELNTCIKCIYVARSELNRIEDTNRQLVADLEKSKEEFRSFIHKKDEVPENNIVEQLVLEKTELNNKILELDKQIKILSEMIKNNEEDYIKKLGELEKQNLFLSEENEVIKSSIKDFEINLERSKKDLELSIKLQKQLSFDLSNANQNNNDYSDENTRLKSEISDMEEKLKCVQNNNLTIKEKHKEVSNELRTLKVNYDSLVSERDIFSNNIKKIEKDLEDHGLKYLSVLKKNEELSNEVVTLGKKYSKVYEEKTFLQNKVHQLKGEFENNKLKYDTLLETSKQQNEELLNLRTKMDELSIENDDLHNKIADLTSEIETTKIEYSNALEVKEKVSQELELLNKEHSTLTMEKNKIQREFKKLEKELIDVKEDNKKLLTEISSLSLECSSKEKEIGLSQQQNEELLQVKRQMEDLRIENNGLHGKITDLNNDTENIKIEYTKVLELKEKVSQELEYLKKEHSTLTIEKNLIQSEFKKLEQELADVKEDNQKLSKEISCLSLQCSSKEKEIGLSQQQNEELQQVKRQMEDLRIENNGLQGKITDLTNEAENIKIEYTKVLELKGEVSQELEYLKKEHSTLTLEKNKIQLELQKLEQELADVKEDSKQLTKKINSLSLDCSNKEKEIALLQENLTNAVNDLAEREKYYNSLLDSKNKLTEETNNLKKEKEDLTGALTEMRSNLDEQLEKLNDTTKKYNLLSSSFKQQCYDLEDKSKQISLLESGKQALLKDLNETKALNEKVKIKNNILLGEHKTNKNILENMRQIQKKMHDVFLLFKEEIYNELDNIRYKINNDLKQHIDNVLLENKVCNARFEELDYKNKEGINSYNSKIKSIHEDIKPKSNIQLQNDIIAFDEKKRKISIEDPKKCDFSIENQSKVNDKKEFYENKCHELETNLKQAISVIHCMRKQLSTKQTQQSDYLSDDLFNEEFHGQINNADNFNISRQISKLESFYNNYEIKYKDGNTTGGSDNTEGYLSDNNETIDHLKKKNKNLFLNLIEIHEFYKSRLKTVSERYENKAFGDYEEMEDFKSLETENLSVISEVESRIEKLRENLNEKGDSLDTFQEEYQPNRNQARDEELQKLRISYEKEMREQDKKWRNCLDRRLLEEESRHKAEVTRLTTEWNIIRKELETASRVAVSALESGSASGEVLRNQVHALTLQLTQLQEKRCDSCGLNIFPKDHNRSRSIQDCTEMEYLRNIMYTYMMGKEPLVLAKVLCALLKFDDVQTKDILLKEEQKITLLGQLGIL